MAASLRKLDQALGWTEGTSWDLAKGSHLDLSREMLDDEEETLVHGPSLSDAENDLRNFSTIVMGKLREMDPDRREAVMADIARMLGVF